MDREELDLQYSPSRWSRRFRDPAAVIENHVKVITSASSAAKTKVPAECGVRYGPRDGQMLDVFGGQILPGDAPILVYVHGGYWQELSRDISAYCVEPLYQSGVRVIVVGYDLAPTVTVADIVEEVRVAATHIVGMAANLGARSVWFAGHSAGAHLVAMLLYSKWLHQLDIKLWHRVKGFILISGVFDLTPLVDTYVNDTLKLSREEAKAISPMLLDIIGRRQLKIVIAVGEHDSPEFKRQSLQFSKKLGGQVELHTVAGADHFDIVERLQQRDFALTKRIVELVTSDM